MKKINTIGIEMKLIKYLTLTILLIVISATVTLMTIEPLMRELRVLK